MADGIGWRVTLYDADGLPVLHSDLISAKTATLAFSEWLRLKPTLQLPEYQKLDLVRIG